MKKRNSIDIAVTQGIDGSTARLRIIPKPNRYQKTRYWVVLPGAGATGDRWLLEPSVERAVGRVGRWLLKEAGQYFVEPELTSVGGNKSNPVTGTIPDDPRAPTPTAFPAQTRQTNRTANSR